MLVNTSSLVGGRAAPAVLIALAGLAMAPSSALAQSWDGFGATANWSDAGNWSGSPAPVSSNSTAIFFGAGLQLNSVQNIATPFQLFDLTFNSSAGNYNLSGGEIQFVGGRLFYNASSTITINNNLSVAAGFGGLNIQGTGTGTLALNGNIVTNTALAKVGAYTLLLNGTNSLTGTVSIGDASNNGGVLGAGSAAALGTSASMTIGAGSTFRAFGTFSQTRSMTAQGTLGAVVEVTAGNTLTHNGTMAGTTFNKTGAGTLIVGNTGSFTGVLNVSGGTLQASAANQLGSAAGQISLTNNARLRGSAAFNISRTLNIGSGGGTLDLAHAGNTNLGTLTGTGTLTKQGTGTLVLTNTVGTTFAGAFNIEEGTVQTAASLSTGSGPVTVSNDATLRFHDGWAGTQSLTMGTGGGRIDVPTGLATYSPSVGGTKLTKTGAGRLDLTGGASLLGGLNVLGGELRLTGEFGSGALSTVAGTLLSGQGSWAGAMSVGGDYGRAGASPLFSASSLSMAATGDLNFEFTQQGGPDFSAPGATLNDVLRLTGTAPLGAIADGARLDFFLNTGAAIIGGEVFRGGLFTDISADFIASLSAATVRVFVADPQGPVSYGAQAYSPLDLPFTLSTVEHSAALGSGVVNGRILQIAVVPTPGAAGLLALGALVISRRRRA